MTDGRTGGIYVPPRQPTSPSPAQRPPMQRDAPHGLRQLSRRRRKWPWVVLIIAVLLIAAVAGAYLWYQRALLPLDPQAEEETLFVVDEGDSVVTISQALEEKGIIHSSYAMRIYTELSGTKGNLQVGRYMVSPAQSVPDITDMLVEGASSEVPWTVIPGETLREVRTSLLEIGYSEEEVETALTASYDHPLLEGKPENASLEGYIYPETYFISPDETIETVLERTFDEFYVALQQAEMYRKLEAQDMTFYEALTLASIVEREVISPEDRRQVAQIFLKRLDEDMPLGADSTFVYAAELRGVEPTISIDSPYNTREVAGLPPGPIGSIDMSALEAVVSPAEGEYLYFVTGDDGVNHFSKTEEEHEENVQEYCQELCYIYRE